MTTHAASGKDSPSFQGEHYDNDKRNRRQIAGERGLTRIQSKAVAEAVFAAITAASTSGDETSIPGFGRFKVKDTPEREARNPATGATIKVAAAKKLIFTPAKALKDALNT
jgi:DNA-binding protein HU-beta